MDLKEDIDYLDPKSDLEKPLSNLAVISETEEYYKGLIKWHVPKPDIEKYLNCIGGNIKSQWFYVGPHSYCCFYLSLYPNGKNDSLKEFVSLSITFHEKLPESTWMEGVMSIVGKRKMCKNFTTGNYKDIDSFVEIGVLREYVAENDLIIQCSIRIKLREVKCAYDDKIVHYKLSREINPYNKIIYKHKNFSDVTFCVEGNEIKAHKALLLKIPYFQELFRDSCNQNFELPHIKYCIFEHVLQFIYTGDIPVFDFKLACEIYIVAYDLEIFDLKNMCSAYLGANLTVQNVCIVIKLSHECNDIPLKKECFEFIKKSDSDVLAKSSIVV